MNRNRKELLEMSMSKLFIKIAIPSMLGMLALGLYNMVDAIFVGQLVSSEGVGAIVVAYNIVTLNLAGAMLFGMGSMSAFSRAIGEKDTETINKLFGNVLIGTSIISLLLTLIVQQNALTMLQFLGAKGDILILGTRYLKVISLGFIFSAVGPALNFLIRGEGQMQYAMKVIISGMVLNIILDPIFISVFKMGIEGAALATVVSQILVVIGDFAYFKMGKSMIKLSKHSFRMSLDNLKKIMNVGFSGMVMQLMSALQMSVMFRVLSAYGSDSVILMSASYRVMVFAFFVLWGIAQGVQPIVGANYGAKQYKRVKEAFVTYTLITSAIAGVLWLVFMFVPQPILGWFITDGHLVQQGVNHFRRFLGIFILYGFLSMAICFFQAIGKGKEAATLVIGRQLVFFIPIVLMLPTYIGEKGAWLAIPLSDFFAILLGAGLLLREFAVINRAIMGYDNRPLANE